MESWNRRNMTVDEIKDYFEHPEASKASGRSISARVKDILKTGCCLFVLGFFSLAHASCSRQEKPLLKEEPKPGVQQTSNDSTNRPSTDTVKRATHYYYDPS